MAFTTNDFPAITDDLQSIFNEEMKRRIATMVGFRVFDVRDTDRRTYDHLIMHGVKVISAVAQGADLPSASSNEGDSATWTQNRYGGIVSVTKDMRMFELYDQIMSQPKAAVSEAFDLIDQSLADVLLNGWSSSYTDVYSQTHTATTPASQTVFNTAHTNNINSVTFRNQIRLISSSTENPALSRQAVVDAKVDAMTYSDPNGLVRPVRLDTLIVPPGLADLAFRIVESPGVQGTDNVDVNNFLAGINVIVWERLQTSGQGTDTSGYWFMCDSSQVGESLKALFAERPSLDPPEMVYKNKNWDYSVDYYYTIGRGFPAYVWGSKGTNAA